MFAILMANLTYGQAFRVTDLDPAGDGVKGKLQVLGNSIIFNGSTGDIQGDELYITDGTAAGTNLLLEINPGNYNTGNPGRFYEWNNIVYFEANDGGAGSNAEVWRTDGTAAGTFKLTEINPGGDALPRNFFAFNNELYFGARPSNSVGIELFKTNGTAAGTSMVKDISPSSNSSSVPQRWIIWETIFSKRPELQ